MKFIIITSITLICLFSVMLYDNLTYNYKEKHSNIKKLASKVSYSNISLQFKSNDYKEFVYAK